jgi:hypothetical protein
VFYRTIQLCDWPRSDAIVDFIVLEDQFAVFLDSETQALVFRQTVKRDPIREVINLPLSPDLKHSGPNQVLVKAPDPNALTQQIEAFFKKYFAQANEKTHISAPVFHDEPREPDYVGLKVAGVKKQVLAADNYWEKIAISVEIRPTPEGQRLICYMSGKYASGWGSRLPSDDDYKEVEDSKMHEFVSGILRKLQDSLAGGGQ